MTTPVFQACNIISPVDDRSRRLLPEEVGKLMPMRWEVSADGRAIDRCFCFADFSAAFAFMTRVALLAHQHDHHPEWRNVYNRVDVRWTTHDVGGLSALDFELARRCDELADPAARV
jgi:4a-hydroxytetrahydrobiopterin dehydratase